MNLILHSLDNVTDPTWSVIILLCCGLLFTLYCVAYILILAFQEMRHDGQTQEQEGEVCQRETE
jgi:hypothetical protein